jgi:hypothetical protein
MVGSQPSLFAPSGVTLNPEATFERIELADGAWVDVARDWLGGADVVCDQLVEDVSWPHPRRHPPLSPPPQRRRPLP